MRDPDTARTRALLAEVLGLGSGQIRNLYKKYPEAMTSERTIPKLEYMRAHYTPEERRFRSQLNEGNCAFFLLTPEEFRFISEIPELMGFSEEERARYRRVIFWHSYTADLRPLLPQFSQLCGGKEKGWKFIRQMYLWDLNWKTPEEIAVICDRLLSYERRILPEVFTVMAFSLFSVHSDPLYALDVLSARFKPEAVMDIIFIDLDVNWPRLAYRVRKDPERYRDEFQCQLDRVSHSIARRWHRDGPLPS